GRQLDRPVVEPRDVLRRRADALPAPGVEAEMVVVAVDGDERGHAQVRLLLETEDVAVEREALLHVADVEMDVPDAKPCADLRRRRLARDDAEQTADGVRMRAARVDGVPGRPLLPRLVGGELDAVAVRVRQVDRLVRAVVGHPVDRRPRVREPERRPRELEPRGEEERVVVEAGVPPGRASGSSWSTTDVSRPSPSSTVPSSRACVSRPSCDSYHATERSRSETITWTGPSRRAAGRRASASRTSVAGSIGPSVARAAGGSRVRRGGQPRERESTHGSVASPIGCGLLLRSP